MDDVRIFSDIRDLYRQTRSYACSESRKLRERLVKHVLFKRRKAIENIYERCIDELLPHCVEAILAISRGILEKEVKRSRKMIEKKVEKLLPKLNDIRDIVVRENSPGDFEIQTRSGKIFYKWEDELEQIADSLRKDLQR